MDGEAPGAASPLRAEQAQRYARHLSLPLVGLPGQRRLLDSRVLVVGAGGLGAPVLQYLAAAGVGSITIVDDDEVQLSNLQRQVIHGMGDLGAAKVESATRSVAAINPDVQVRAVRERLDVGNVVGLCADQDIVIDATDNFATRFLLNDACVLLGLPLVWAAINQFDGQVTVWSPGQGPCLRCLFPVAPDPAAVPSCAAAGVLGVLPGLLGVAQASEALKVLLGIGRPLIGRLAIFDALAFEWSQIPIAADPGCGVCGPEAEPVVIRDEPASEGSDPEQTVETVTALEVAEQLAAGRVHLVDVRTATEWERSHIERAQWLVLDDIRSGADPKLDSGPLVLVCRSGARSAQAARVLSGRGIEARSLDGGMLAWVATVDPTLTLD